MRNIRMAGIALLLALNFILQGCQKELQQHDSPDHLSIAEARHYFEEEYARISPSAKSNPRSAQVIAPDWAQATEQHSPNGAAIIVPVQHKQGSYVFGHSSKYYYPLDSITKLYIYKNKENSLQAAKITYLPDDDYIERGRSYSGLILIEDWHGQKLATYKRSPSGELLVETPEKGQAVSAKMECIYFEGYNYSKDDPEGYHYSQLVGCYFTPTQVAPVEYDKALLPPANGGGGGGGSSPTYGSLPAVYVVAGKNPIPNINHYLRCFTTSVGNINQYKVSIAVVQPKPGTRETWAFAVPKSITSPPIFVGHTFLILSQSGPSQTTTRNVGFYPINKVIPDLPMSPAHLNNDENMDYHVMLTVSMNSIQFFNVLNYIEQGESFTYDLNRNNCTTFALAAMGAAGIHVKSTPGTWAGGGGYNPGDLGEDIRQMTTTSNMQINTISNIHPNLGICR